MTRDTTREWWYRTYNEIVHTAVESKDTGAVLRRLFALYKGVPDDDRPTVNEAIIEMIDGSDEAMRFGARSLVSEFQIREAVGALHRLIARLRGATVPGAPFELADAEEILRQLGTA